MKSAVQARNTSRDTQKVSETARMARERAGKAIHAALSEQVGNEASRRESAS